LLLLLLMMFLMLLLGRGAESLFSICCLLFGWLIGYWLVGCCLDRQLSLMLLVACYFVVVVDIICFIFNKT
jgi:hypothetical protein